MPQLSPATIRARAGELRAEVADVRRTWLESLLGREQSVLAEADGTGHSGNFARIATPAGTPRGAIVAVTPRAIEAGLLR
jgi:threonylcarbamoyladenosine tRNA methylthiotransferase MtaB